MHKKRKFIDDEDERLFFGLLGYILQKDFQCRKANTESFIEPRCGSR